MSALSDAIGMDFLLNLWWTYTAMWPDQLCQFEPCYFARERS